MKTAPVTLRAYSPRPGLLIEIIIAIQYTSTQTREDISAIEKTLECQQHTIKKEKNRHAGLEIDYSSQK